MKINIEELAKQLDEVYPEFKDEEFGYRDHIISDVSYYITENKHLDETQINFDCFESMDSSSLGIRVCVDIEKLDLTKIIEDEGNYE